MLARIAFAANRFNAMFVKKLRMDFMEIMWVDMECGDVFLLLNDLVVKMYWVLMLNLLLRGVCLGWIEAFFIEVGDGDGYFTARFVGGW